eukprot:TRINITY_DN49737_c0_g1_i1.p1 TRINITY_DN49737_c0_g1~~TRINITY_DN49737_c0_g1_i1.p1  ORF type:complete len:304 (-),score=85.12 TRINITY_DN49737_c0_g1_i1:450-1304(-)
MAAERKQLEAALQKGAETAVRAVLFKVLEAAALGAPAAAAVVSFEDPQLRQLGAPNFTEEELEDCRRRATQTGNEKRALAGLLACKTAVKKALPGGGSLGDIVVRRPQGEGPLSVKLQGSTTAWSRQGVRACCTLSYTDTMAVAAGFVLDGDIGPQIALGLDVESQSGDRWSQARFIDRNYTYEEQEQCKLAGEHAAAARFADLWTGKEAAAKALGGLGAKLKGGTAPLVDIVLEREGEAKIAFADFRGEAEQEKKKVHLKQMQVSFCTVGQMSVSAAAALAAP